MTLLPTDCLCSALRESASHPEVCNMLIVWWSMYSVMQVMRHVGLLTEMAMWIADGVGCCRSDAQLSEKCKASTHP